LDSAIFSGMDFPSIIWMTKRSRLYRTARLNPKNIAFEPTPGTGLASGESRLAWLAYVSNWLAPPACIVMQTEARPEPNRQASLGLRFSGVPTAADTSAPVSAERTSVAPAAGANTERQAALPRTTAKEVSSAPVYKAVVSVP
jgi:hypothetical protein